VEAYGWVSFDVEGEKPGILKAAPDFLLDSVINVRACLCMHEYLMYAFVYAISVRAI
jgi:hypothetical protein